MALIELARFYNSFEAGVVQSRLEAEGIPSVLFDLEMSLQAMGMAIPIRLMIDDEDEGAARAILADAQDMGDGA
ncbi:Putative signal transducing protein [Sphingomonas laterariae]|uniref:Putative signal transducing protein n=1 Tax=Edaphosphingomonas laterariae TaxID=861865 RepID=A0A239FGF7_9SPHN|nr:DUF2007 domain-containing protein [Sphingomonas laterariae]SNS56009.1 Putative signal transducing protein [Sphingomonas laterariae]